MSSNDLPIVKTSAPSAPRPTSTGSPLEQPPAQPPVAQPLEHIASSIWLMCRHNFPAGSFELISFTGAGVLHIGSADGSQNTLEMDNGTWLCVRLPADPGLIPAVIYHLSPGPEAPKP